MIHRRINQGLTTHIRVSRRMHDRVGRGCPVERYRSGYPTLADRRIDPVAASACNREAPRVLGSRQYIRSIARYPLRIGSRARERQSANDGRSG